MSYFEFSEKLLGGKILIAFYDLEEATAKELFDRAYNEGLRLQKIFNFFDTKSELSKLNNRRKMRVSNELLEVLTKAIEYCEKTKGAYDISIGKNIIERKTNKPLSKINCTYQDIAISGHEVSLKHMDVLLDFGSLAKGYIVDKLTQFLASEGVENFFIDARGDMRSYGEHKEAVEVKHPRKEGAVLGPFTLQNKAIATSGDYNQYYENYDKSHILGQKELISVTVIANTTIEADVFASAVFLLSQKEREALIHTNPLIKVFVINKELKEKKYNGF